MSSASDDSASETSDWEDDASSTYSEEVPIDQQRHDDVADGSKVLDSASSQPAELHGAHDTLTQVTVLYEIS